MQYFGFGSSSSEETSLKCDDMQRHNDSTVAIETQRLQATLPGLRKSNSESDDENPKDRIRKIEKRAAATQQRSLDKKIQALTGEWLSLTSSWLL